MSSELLYNPGVSEREYILHRQAKYVLAPLVWEGYDGSEGSSKEFLGKSSLPMLKKAKKSANTEAAAAIQTLINSIRRNNGVWIWLQR